MTKKLTARDHVELNIQHLRTLATASELTAWARSKGIDSAAGFSSFKKALLVGGIDFDAIRGAGRIERAAAMSAKATKAITLYSDAKASKSRFGITDRHGEPVWYGLFFDRDADFNGEQSSGELAAAKKAVWLASQAAKQAGLPAIHLILHVDAEWLCWANAVATADRSGGKARELGEMARRLCVVLDVRHVPGAENPADAYTVCSGFRSWKDADLLALIEDLAE